MYVSSESKASIKCINCGRPILPSKIGVHLKECMKTQKVEDGNKNGKQIVNAQSYVSNDIRDSVFDEFGGFSGTKSSMMGKSSQAKQSQSKAFEDDFEDFDESDQTY